MLSKDDPLREWLEQAGRNRSRPPRGEDQREIDGDGDSQPWRTPHGLTLEQCNAIRESARDGNSFADIAREFSFLDSRNTARVHAAGRCSHHDPDNGVPPIQEERSPGPDPWRVNESLCETLRRKWESGEFETFTEAADWAGVSRKTAARHIKGSCGHG